MRFALEDRGTVVAIGTHDDADPCELLQRDDLDLYIPSPAESPISFGISTGEVAVVVAFSKLEALAFGSALVQAARVA
jgi:hypothetical protein